MKTFEREIFIVIYVYETQRSSHIFKYLKKTNNLKTYISYEHPKTFLTIIFDVLQYHYYFNLINKKIDFSEISF